MKKLETETAVNRNQPENNNGNGGGSAKRQQLAPAASRRSAKRQQAVSESEERQHQIYDCKVFDAAGNLKRVVTAEEQWDRSMDRLEKNLEDHNELDIVRHVCPSCGTVFRTAYSDVTLCGVCRSA